MSDAPTPMRRGLILLLVLTFVLTGMASPDLGGNNAYAGTGQNTNVRLTKTASQTTISGSTQITYTYTIENIGPTTFYWRYNYRTPTTAPWGSSDLLI